MAKIILTQPISGLGTAGDTLEVKNGYARNYLLPRGFAITWTEGAGKQIETIQKARLAHAEKDKDVAQQTADNLKKNGVSLKVRAGDKGKLFGTVTNKDVAQAIKDAGLGEIDRRQVELPKTVKSLGTYSAIIHLHDDVVEEIEVKVLPDNSKGKKK